MTTILLSAALCLAALMSLQGTAQTTTVRDLAAQADIIVVAEVVEVGESPGFWAGYMSPTQPVTYRQVEVLKGSLSSNQFRLEFVISSLSRIVEKDQPRLSSKLFAPGNRHVLFLEAVKEGDPSPKIPIMDDQGRVTLKDPSEFIQEKSARKTPVTDEREATALGVEHLAVRSSGYVPGNVIEVLKAEPATMDLLKTIVSQK